MRLGIPSTLTPGNAILSAVSYSDGTDTYKALLLELDLSLMAYQWLKILGDDDSTPSGQCPSPENLIQTFDGQCSSLRARHAGAWCQRLEIMLHAIHLQVYSFAINRKDTLDPSTPSAGLFSDVVLAKTQSTAVQLISEVAVTNESSGFWPVFAQHSVISAGCICIYMAATTTDVTARTTLLEACKTAAAILARWSMFSKDNFSRIGRHIATAVWRVESQGAVGLRAIDDGTHKASVSARMAANIPYRIIWNVKHGRTPDSSTEVQHSIPATEDTSTFPALVAGANASSLQNAPESLNLLFNDWNDIALFDSMTEAEFTDILLDWQSLRGPVPDWT